MRLVDQTKFGSPDGNCLSACVATIFALNIDDVPSFTSPGWWKSLEDWSAVRLKMTPVMRSARLSAGERVPIAIACGKSPRGLKHAVVWQHGEMLHDPHPDRSGIESVDYFICFEPVSESEAGK